MVPIGIAVSLFVMALFLAVIACLASDEWPEGAIGFGVTAAIFALPLILRLFTAAVLG
jgi:hypothetical protein